MSKFKVGDKVKIIEPGSSYTLLTTEARKLQLQSNGRSYKWEKGFGYEKGIDFRKFRNMVGEIVALNDTFVLVNLDFGSLKRSIVFANSIKALALYEELFTFEEVIARIQEGEVYENILNNRTKRIIGRDGYVSLEFTGDYQILGTHRKYKLVPQKKEYQLYEVEHQENGKRHLFRSMLKKNIGEMVVCDTKFGKSYGQVVNKVTKELTEEEYKAYKLIIKSV